MKHERICAFCLPLSFVLLAANSAWADDMMSTYQLNWRELMDGWSD